MIQIPLIILSRVVRLLPRRLILTLGDAIGLFWFSVVRFRRQVAIDNVRDAMRLNDSDVKKLVALNFRHLGRLLVEVVETATWKRQDYARRVRFHNRELVDRLIERGQGGIFLTVHVGNWELELASGPATGLPIDVIVKRPKNAVLERALRWYRQRTGAGILAETGTARDILRSLSRGRWPVFLLDQFMGPPIGLPVSFFGRPAGTAVALALISEKRDVPIIPVYSYRDADGVHHVVFEDPIEYADLGEEKNQRLHRKTQRYSDVMESIVRRHPEQWLWIHRRWKAYRGEHRWPLPSPVLVASTLLFSLVLSCASVPDRSGTGIPIPPDPTIAVPQVTTIENKNEEDSDTVQVSVPSSPVPTPVATPERKPKKAPRIDKKKAVLATPAATPTPLAGDGSVLQVVNADKVPFDIGEYMEIELAWAGLSAGTVSMEVREGPRFGGRPTFQLWGNALSSRLVDQIYHIDNTIESFVDTQALIPYKFLLHMSEVHQSKETRVAFDHIKHRAYYWAKRVSKKWGDENVDRQDDLAPLSKDMYSGVYFARSLSFVLNKKANVPVYENGQNMNVELLPVANEIVRTPAGVFQCWKLQLFLTLNNVLKPTGDLFLWLSDDSKRYVVKFDAKLKLGSLYGKLVKVRERK